MELLTVNGVRDYIERLTGLRFGHNAIYRWINTGVVSSVRIGKRLLVPKADIDAMIQYRAAQKEKGGQI